MASHNIEYHVHIIVEYTMGYISPTYTTCLSLEPAEKTIWESEKHLRVNQLRISAKLSQIDARQRVAVTTSRQLTTGSKNTACARLPKDNRKHLFKRTL